MEKRENLKCARCGIEVEGLMPVRGILTFMRHGQTNLNRQNRSVGTIDEPMNDTGRKQIQEAARAMKQKGLCHFDTILTSPLWRAHEAALIVQQVMGGGMAVKVNPLLGERCVGVQQGQPETPESDSQWLRYDFTLEGAEPLIEYEMKIREFISMANRAFYASHVLFMTHGFALLTIVKFIKGLTVEEVMKFEPPPNAGTLTFMLGDLCPQATCGSEFYEYGGLII